MSQRNTNEPGRMMDRAVGIATSATLQACAAWLGLLCVTACCPDVRETACRTECQQRLFQIHAALTEYVKMHGDIPRDEHGTPRLAELCHAVATPRNKECSVDICCPCAAKAERSEYIVNPQLCADDLTQGSTTIVACDRCSNHRSGRNGTLVTVALLGHGTTVLVFLPEAEQAEWRKLFAAGDEKAAIVKIVEDDDGAESLMWYLGKERGYVKALQ
jgi:hypothetical protein